MPQPEIQTHERPFQEVFDPSNPEFSTRLARVCVLFEDLRLESYAARHTEPIELLDTTSKQYRYCYFLRRMMASLDEFCSAVQQLNSSAEWKRIRAQFDWETEKRWDSAVRFVTNNRPAWSDLRNTIGAHLLASGVKYAIENVRPDTTAKIQTVVYREERTAGIRFLFAEEVVAVAMKQALGPGRHTDEELAAYLNGLFTVMLEGVNEAVKIGHVIAAVYFLERFRQ